MKTTVVVPTYNEAENVRPMVDALLSLPVADVKVLVVDDASPDGTGEIADQLALERPGYVEVLHRSGPRGLGRSYVDGFRTAIQGGADLVVQMDCDFSHAPRDVPRLIDQANEVDVVIGSRYVPGGRTDEDWGWGRKMLSWWANSVYARLILGTQVKDTTAGFKCWRADTLRGIGLHRIRSQGYVFQVEMAYVTERLGYRALEIPIYFEDRRIGESKMVVPIKLEAALRVWELRFRLGRLTPQDRIAA
jgi:dolichol-phosphate mannosyltransferase